MTTRKERHQFKKAEKKIIVYKIGNWVSTTYMYLFLFLLLAWLFFHAFTQKHGISLQWNLNFELTPSRLSLFFSTFLLSGLLSILTENAVRKNKLK
ncbi:hypothetical protein [Ammoniphilus sp. 3BR4]|uniref:hypothetical protein n=1 Tax=Ammoniphilus sp. 3BR4 TaxID=3158265 RepID=UPI0034674869